MINVTKTFLPPHNEYQAILKRAWDQGWITNRGILVEELEKELKAYLDVPNLIAATNGTLPLQVAIKALQLKGEIITTPFSYIATTSTIVWEGCTPVFVDIHPDFLTIDESKIEASITPDTEAILVTHVYGNPCDVDAIDAIAKKHHLKVIYDAAHCFGVTYKGRSIFSYGDVSTCSFHATKLFHTGEGGAIITNSRKLHDVLFYHHNFGHDGPERFHGLGINAKMSELQAAMGLAVLPHIDKHISLRKERAALYDNAFQGSDLRLLKIRSHTEWNYSYYPIILKDEKELQKVKAKLVQAEIYPRRYFYPGLNSLPYIQNKECPVTDSIASSVLCLPLYHDLAIQDVNQIISIITGR